jgi:SAM-dependent methyltransferase
LLPASGHLLLELGAGAGRNTPRYHGFDRIVLLDYSLSQLQLAQNRLGRDRRFVYVAADIYRLPFASGLFDAATMIRTLHHMADVRLALEQVRRVLLPDSVFVLEYANKRNIKSILRFWLRRQSWNPFSLEPVEFVELNFDFHPHYIHSLLVENQFTIQRKLTVSHFRIPFLKKIVPLKWLIGMDSVAQLTGNWWQLTPSVFVRSQAEGESIIAESKTFFCCPECGSVLLEETETAITCKSCSKVWNIQDGIYDFRQPVNS